jgi:two-component system KDP operon response regulator KdpE
LSDLQFRVFDCEDGVQALGEAVKRHPDILILDLGLPGMGGMELLKRLREYSDVPVLVVSGRSNSAEKIAVLDAGADDYLLKPFSNDELVARMRVLLRDSRSLTPIQKASFADVEIDFPSRKVTKSGVELVFTETEYALLRELAFNQGKIVPHAILLKRLWGTESDDQVSYLRIYVHRVRKKIESIPEKPRHLLTVQGVGYRLVS